MSVSPTIVANFFLQRASEEGRALTPMQLIKLVYIAHGWTLGYFDRPLIDETVRAWKFGPVVDSLYHALKQYGSGAVTTRALPIAWLGTKKLDEDIKPLLESVWNAYKGFSGVQLSAMTHQIGTPWDITWNRNGGNQKRGAAIPDELVTQHYKDKIARSQEKRDSDDQ